MISVFDSPKKIKEKESYDLPNVIYNVGISNESILKNRIENFLLVSKVNVIDYFGNFDRLAEKVFVSLIESYYKKKKRRYFLCRKKGKFRIY